MALSKFKHEIHRLNSFKEYNRPAHILALARLGFLLNERGRICCYQCGFSVADSEVDNDVIVKHRQISPTCTTATNNDQRNVPMKPLRIDFETRTKPEIWTTSSKARETSTRDRTDNIKGYTETDCDAVEMPPFALTCRNILKRGISKGIVLVEIDPNRPDFEALKMESVRLSTFRLWPKSAHVTKEDLARNGFYYTGSGDRVQCVFCRGYLKNWAVDDDVSDEHKRHFAACAFVLGKNVGNVALAHDLNEGHYNIMAVERTPPDAYDDSSLQETRSIQPVAIDSPNSMHLQHSASHRPAESSDTQFMSIGSEDAILLDQAPAYPVKHPQFTDRQTRSKTFMYARGRLPRGQNVDTLVDAGFFHVGPLDNVKCFCCDIGLKNWQNDDDPWTEHARWSPRCAFVLEKRGEAFVQETVAANRQRLLNRANQNNIQLPSLNVEPANLSLLGSQSIPPVRGDGASDGVRRPDVVGIGEQLLGAPGAVIRVDRDAGLPVGEVYLDEQQAREARRQRQLNGSAAAAVAAANGNGVENDPEAQHLLAENQQLRQVKTCKVCMDKEVNIVFLPCGHLVCCEECAPNLRTCAICRTYIRGTVKVFLS